MHMRDGSGPGSAHPGQHNAIRGVEVRPIPCGRKLYQRAYYFFQWALNVYSLRYGTAPLVLFFVSEQLHGGRWCLLIVYKS